MTHFISSFFRFICIIVIFDKIIAKENKTKTIIFPHAISMSILLLLITYINALFPTISLIFSILIFTLISIIIYNTKFEISLFSCLFSHTIFYITNYLSSFITMVLLCPLYYFNKQQPYLLLALLTGILTLISCFLLLSSKRTQKRLRYLFSPSLSRPVFILCLLILTTKIFDNYYTYNYVYKSDVYIDLFLPLATFLLAILLFTWWRRQITKSYIEKLRKLELQSLYDELTEKEEQIKKLTGDNEALSRIVHKDNKLIPAMEHLVSEFLSDNNFNNPEELKQYGNRLTKQLHDMTRDRRGILENYEHGNHKLKLTGHVALDAILVYMQKKAEDQNILFECKHNEDSLNYLLSKISEEDLSHLLSDFLENAIISMRKTGNGRLQVVFGKLQKEAYISVSDTGSDFNLSTLHSFGLSPNTTHGNDGGSGIGLMDIWKLKRKYRATIQIQEYEKNSNTFTKRILFSFNSKNHYVIQSYRHAEISNSQTRGDLYVIPMDTTRKNEGKEYERNDQNLNS